MKKSIIALFLVAMMLVSVFSGCGADKAAEESTAPAESQQVSEAPAPEEPAEEAPAEPEAEPVPEEETEPVSEGFKLFGSSVVTFPLVEEPTTLTVYTRGPNTRGAVAQLGISSYTEFSAIQWLQEQTGIELDFTEVSHEVFSEQFNLYMAGGECADILVNAGMVYSGGVVKGFEDEVFLDLTPYMDEFAPNYMEVINSDPEVARQAKSDGGYILNFCALNETIPARSGFVTRADWLEEQGVEVPTTYDELDAWLRLCQTEYGCDVAYHMNQQCYADGITGGYDVAGFNVGQSALPYLVHDGVVECSLATDKYKEYLSMLAEWYADGIIEEDFMSIVFDPMSKEKVEKISNNRTAVWGANANDLTAYESYVEGGIPVVAVPNLVKNEGEKDHTGKATLFGDDTLCIFEGCENPELAISLVDYFFSEAGQRIYNFGKEGDTWEMVDGEIQLTEKVLNNELGLSPSNVLSMAAVSGVFMGVTTAQKTAFSYNQLQLETMATWLNSFDGEYVSNASLNSAESEEYNSLASDIATYASENIPRFIMGELDLETEWSGFVDHLKSMNIDRCVEIQQGAYDRFISR